MKLDNDESHEMLAAIITGILDKKNFCQDNHENDKVVLTLMNLVEEAWTDGYHFGQFEALQHPMGHA